MSSEDQTKKERREAARAARVQGEADAAAAAARKRRLTILGGLLAGAIVVVVIAIAVSGGSSSKPKAKAGEKVAGQRESAAMLAGIPQSGITLGNPKAKVTLLEFADLQCPICAQYTLSVMPQIVQDYVRTGKVKMQLRLLSFLGPDSVSMAKYAYGAQLQDKLWNFSDLVYFNQGPENSGYGTPAFMNKIGSAIRGFDTAKASAAAATPAATASLGSANTLANRYGVTGTPTLLAGPSGGDLKQIVSGLPTLKQMTAALDAALKQ